MRSNSACHPRATPMSCFGARACFAERSADDLGSRDPDGAPDIPARHSPVAAFQRLSVNGSLAGDEVGLPRVDLLGRGLLERRPGSVVRLQAEGERAPIEGGEVQAIQGLEGVEAELDRCLSAVPMA